LLWLKRWIWVYFWLLIFEGVLRKWVVPALSGPLLLIRDPVALIVYIQAYRSHRISMKTMWPVAMVATGVVLLAGAQVMTDVETVSVALYGLRSYVLHLPMIFIIAETLDAEDLRRFGGWLLMLSIPMSALVMAQYRSSGDAWLNAGAGLDSGQIASAGGHIRPAGTFSYGAGMQCLEVLFASILLDALMRKGRYPQWLIWASLIATIAMVPALGSRTVLFTLVALALFTLAAGISDAARVASLLKIAVVLALALFIVIQLPIFNDAVQTMAERWQQSEKSEGGVQDVLGTRIFGVVGIGLEAAGNTPLLGRGIGMGSNFAAVSTTGEASFMLGESEWERVIPEFGPLAGLLFMGARVAFAFYIIMRAYRAMKRNEPLAWQLVPAVIPVLLLDLMEQPTFLGFMVFGAGLCLAAARLGDNSRAYSWYPMRAERSL
jgi:hypothetical protein